MLVILSETKDLRWSFSLSQATEEATAGPCDFTNEVQHLDTTKQVLPWVELTYNSLWKRCSIAKLREAGQSFRQIAAALDRAPSTIAREMKRNQGATVGYRPAYALEQAWARRWRGARLVRNAELRQTVLERLAMGHSPQQVAGRLALERGRKVLCAETIYRFIYSQVRRLDGADWRLYLPRAKYKRGYRAPAAGRAPIHLIPHRAPLCSRPAEVLTRSSYGHWEVDTMLFSQPGALLLVAQERRSRWLVCTRQTSKAARPIARQLVASLAQLPTGLRRSATFDNGAEFTHHHQLHASLGIDTYFCDRHAPWQKGGVENAIGRLRRTLPRHLNLNLKLLDDSTLKLPTDRYNCTPRKCLGFLTPQEVFASQLLHFNCVSTPSLRSG